MTSPYWDAERGAWIDENGHEVHCLSCHEDVEAGYSDSEDFYIYETLEARWAKPHRRPPAPLACCCCAQYRLLVRWALGHDDPKDECLTTLDRWPKEAQARVRALLDDLEKRRNEND